MKLLWLAFVKHVRLALLRRKYLQARLHEERLYDAYDCGNDLIDVLTGGELSRIRLTQSNIEKKYRKIEENFKNAEKALKQNRA